MDMSKVKARLTALNSTNTKTLNLWKPTPGKPQVIRIVPYKYQTDNPFIELLFHFGINNKTYLSPSTFGRPDPFVEFAEKLKKTGDKEDWKTGRKFEPKLRTYAPILVRGEENEGVKFWGFGKKVYQSLLGIIADEDYGDITDPVKGHDITVSYVEASGADFASTEIRVKPQKTPVTNDRAVLEKIKNQKDILSMFPELTYDELANVLKNFLNPDTEEGNATADAAAEPATSTDEAPAVKEAATEERSVSQDKTPLPKSSGKLDTADLEKQFDDLFK
jgi:hypothetical protein